MWWQTRPPAPLSASPLLWAASVPCCPPSSMLRCTFLVHISCATPSLSALTLQETYSHDDRPFKEQLLSVYTVCCHLAVFEPVCACCCHLMCSYFMYRAVTSVASSHQCCFRDCGCWKAQFATELPVAGSSFTYVVASLGQVPAFLVMANMVGMQASTSHLHPLHCRLHCFRIPSPKSRSATHACMERDAASHHPRPLAATACKIG